MELMVYVECVTFALCPLKLVECWYVSHDVERGSVKTIIAMMVNKIDRPSTTSTVPGIGTFDLFVASLLFMKAISYCVIRRKTRAEQFKESDIPNTRI